MLRFLVDDDRTADDPKPAFSGNACWLDDGLVDGISNECEVVEVGRQIACNDALQLAGPQDGCCLRLVPPAHPSHHLQADEGGSSSGGVVNRPIADCIVGFEPRIASLIDDGHGNNVESTAC